MQDSEFARMRREHADSLRSMTVRIYLQVAFPGYFVHMLARSPGDAERKSRTFNLRRLEESCLVRVADDVLDLDSVGIRSLLRLFRVAQKVRESQAARAATVVSVTANGASVIPV